VYIKKQNTNGNKLKLHHSFGSMIFWEVAKMLKRNALATLAILLLAYCTNSVEPDISEKSVLSVVSIESPQDTVVSYGSYPDLSTTVLATLSDSSIVPLTINWTASINPVVPMTYTASARLNYPLYGIFDSILTTKVVVQNMDSLLSADTSAYTYLGGGYDSLGMFVGQGINPKAMPVYEKPIHAFQYFCRVIENETDRQAAKTTIYAFLGFSSGYCSTPLQAGNIAIVTIFLYRFKTYCLEGPLKFDGPYRDSLYHANIKDFKNIYGQAYAQQVTPCIFKASEMVLTAHNLNTNDLNAKMARIREDLKLSSDTLIDIADFGINSSSTSSSFIGNYESGPWFFAKSTKDAFADFQDIVQENMKGFSFYISNLRLKQI
jgi:hypothetical protein